MSDNTLLPNTLISLSQIQHKVQHKLGACLIQIQQYERLLQSMLAISKVHGNPETVETNQAARVSDLRSKSLGQLINEHLLKEVVVNAPDDSDNDRVDTDAEERVLATGQPYFGVRLQISMTPEKLENTSQALEEMRSTRNDLVHHFLDKFSLKSEEECALALTYLGTCQATFEANFAQLSEWGKSMLNTRTLAASSMQSQAINDFFDGICPDGTIDWHSSTIVQVLRESEAACGLNGWTLLNTAIAWIGEYHAEQIPSKYHCKTWRQVLRRSGEFQTRTKTSVAGAQGETWFQFNINSQPQAPPVTAPPKH